MRTIALIASTACVAAGVAAIASAHGTARASRSSATVQARSTGLGKILVDSSGATLYEFTRDSRDSDSCVHQSGCSKIWPPLTVHGKPSAGSGVKASLLGTISLAGGAKQVTYAGRPLYLYAADETPGDTDYVGASSFGGTWNAVGTTGQAIKKHASRSSGSSGGGW